MRKLVGVFAMSIMLALAACGGGQKPTTKTYTYVNHGQAITIPASVGNLTLLTGQGGAGRAEDEEYVRAYRKNTKTYVGYENGTVQTTDQGTTYHAGTTPADYCGPVVEYTTADGQKRYTQNCYYHSDASYWSTEPATTGASASITGPNGFSRTYPGGYGGPATPVTQENVAVTPGGQYVLTIPYGGSITMSYFE